MRAGDIEVNPGPDDDDREECYMCNKKLRRGTNFLSCVNCSAKSHKKADCSRKPKGQEKAEWKCQYCREIEQTEEEKCRECKVKARRGQALIKCTECLETMHKKEDCSNIKRGKMKYIRWEIWKCRKCCNPERYEREQQQAQTRIEATGSRDKRKCRMCKQQIRATYDCLVCSKCNKDVHLKKECSGETREAIKKMNRATWECTSCVEREAEKERNKTQQRNATKEVEYVMGKQLNNSVVKLLQWNADSFLSKKEEFKMTIKTHKVDIFLIQETKMTTKDKVPTIPGFTIISKPRKQTKGNENNRGGGLILGIKNSIPFREVEDMTFRDTEDCITESQTVEIPLGKGGAWRISNVYIPSERAGDCRNSTDETKVSTKYWPAEAKDLIVGDLNAHSILWDSELEEGGQQRGIEVKRGELVEAWMDKEGMAVLNDGGATHANRKTGKESTPDLTIVHGSQADRYQWEVLEKLGGSDHKPILITREAEGVQNVNNQYTYKWDLKGAKFDAFRTEVEEKLPVEYENKQVHKLEKILRKVITNAANNHIGTKRISGTAKPAITKEIKKRMEERNILRRDIKKANGRKRWLDKCKEVNTALKKEKEIRWREYVDELDAKTNSRQVWKTIRSLDGRTAPRKENEVLVVEGKAFVGDKQKANEFAKVYKKVSRIKKDPKDRIIKRQNREFLKAIPSSRGRYESEIIWEELERVIGETSNNRSPGDDNIPYDVIKQLGPKAKEFILRMYNRVWSGDPIPQQWRTAVIKPLLKEGKDPKSPGSWRPIALTACLGKTLEKIVADRMSAYMEENNLLNENQAGFRRNRSTTDQVLKLVQMASDKMQQNKDSPTTMVTFFDFSRAYDKVWREGLLHKMIKLGLPYKFIKYTRLFLSARSTRVEINGVRSRKFFLNEGLPQGSAISPLLFLLFINDITEFIEGGATPSLFADDTAIWTESCKDKEKAVKNMQEHINGIANWAAEWKMELNSDKTQLMIISTSREDREWKPKLLLNDIQLEVVKEYKFLGVIIDNQLTFNSHVKKIIAKGRKRNNILRCLAGKDWGQNVDSQKALYATYIRSAAEYASPAWYPWVAKNTQDKIEVIQNEALCIMTRMTRDTPCDFLRLQTGFEPLCQRLEKNSFILREKFMRLDENDGRRKMTERVVQKRLKSKVGWRTETEKMANEQMNRNIGKATVYPMSPLNLTITEVKLTKKKDEHTKEELQRLTECKIAEIDAEVEVYTDGSTAGNQQNGGAGVFIQDRNGNTLLERAVPAGRLCSSYDGESAAFLEALKWVEESNQEGAKVAIYTDSLSLVSALRGNKWKDSHEWLRQIKRKLQELTHNITLCWLPSHCDTYGNEKADKLADAGARMSQETAPVTCSIAKAKIKSKQWQPTHSVASQMFGERRKPRKEEEEWPDNVRSLYARLRCNHAKELRSYQKRIGITNVGNCIYCDMDEEENINHVLCRCPQLECARREAWPDGFTTEMLVQRPNICRKLLGRRFPALRRVGNPQEDGDGSPPGCTGQQA